jgi:hypothetical protein
MRTLLNNVKTIEDYVFGHMTHEDITLFEAKMLLDNNLADDVVCQKHTYSLIRKHSQERIRSEIKTVQNILAAAPQHAGFMSRMANLFRS